MNNTIKLKVGDLIICPVRDGTKVYLYSLVVDRHTLDHIYNANGDKYSSAPLVKDREYILYSRGFRDE
jgi:hypothetical protein